MAAFSKEDQESRRAFVCCWQRCNSQIYPVAWAAVDEETNESWDWFCGILFNDLKIGDGEEWVITSDQQKEILNAVKNWIPRAEHRNCARHIYANWRKKFRDKSWQKFFGTRYTGWSQSNHDQRTTSLEQGLV